MALRNQPYIPLYVQDYLTDEKLNMCSLSTQGVYIKLMCIMHKSDEYGAILLKQKDKQDKNICLNFASKVAKLIPISTNDLKNAISELVDEGVLIIDGDRLYQKRMVKDNAISDKRSRAGKKGGETTQFALTFAKAKSEANSEDEDESVIEDNIIGDFENFWDQYHSITGKPKTDKDAAIKKWKKLTKQEKILAVDKIELYSKSNDNKEYLKKARTYLEDKNFNDQFENKKGPVKEFRNYD